MKSMWKAIKKSIRRFTPQKVKDFFVYEPGIEFATKIYSQEGEDILLTRIFDRSPPGFYIDVGAHHPFRFSNTKLLYDKGWRGIHIDANPHISRLFQEHRPEDVFITMGVGAEQKTLNYYEYNHPALNTFNEDLVSQRDKKPINKIEVQINSLEKILDDLNLGDKDIDLLTIDIEGMDLEALKSINWSKYKPTWIIAETDAETIEKIQESEMHSYLNFQGYDLFSKLWKSVFYRVR